MAVWRSNAGCRSEDNTSGERGINRVDMFVHVREAVLLFGRRDQRCSRANFPVLCRGSPIFYYVDIPKTCLPSRPRFSSGGQVRAHFPSMQSYLVFGGPLCNNERLCIILYSSVYSPVHDDNAYACNNYPCIYYSARGCSIVSALLLIRVFVCTWQT
jgi:hypothetical protein